MMLECIEHEVNDGLRASPEGLLHGVILRVPVSVMEKAGTYRFVLHFYDDYADSYKSHQVKAALEVNQRIAPPYYISDVEDGWLLVKLEPSGEVVALPYTLKVRLNKTQGGRDYFTILEGIHKNKNASVKRKSDGGSYLTACLKHKPPIKPIYSKSSQTLRIEGSSEIYRVIMDPPLPNGTYAIELPDYPHSLGEPYRDIAKRARTWFRIRVEGARYLHTGQRSEGCLIVTDIDKWDRLYDKVIIGCMTRSLCVGGMMRLMAFYGSLIKINSLRTARQLFVFLLGVAVLIGMIFLVIWQRVPKLKPVKQFGALKVGGRIPRFSGISMTGKDLGAGRPPGKFHIYVIDERLPTSCLDLECGKQAEIVINRGGHLIGGSDFKFAKLFGVKVIKTRSLMRRLMYHLPSNIERLARNLGLKVRRDFWSLETSLIVISDCNGCIIGIFKMQVLKMCHIL